MSITTYATLVSYLGALTITGVTRKFTYPPTSLATADLPAMFPQLPRGEEAAMTFQANGGWPAMTCDLVVALEPAAQETQSANFSAAVAMLDKVSAALRGADVGKAPLSWRIEQTGVTVAGINYWAVVAHVTTKG